MLNKEGFVDVIATRHPEMTKIQIRRMISVLTEEIENACVNYGGVTFMNFGTFSVKECGNRPGRNPKTNEPLWISKFLAPIFKPGKEFRDKVRKILN